LSYAWHPSIVDVQMMRMGATVLLMAPGEFSTMAGRRLKRAVEAALRSNGVAEPRVIFGGVSNVCAWRCSC
jgi:neutral ceramidase